MRKSNSPRRHAHPTKQLCAHESATVHVHRAVWWGVQTNGSPCHCPLCDAALKPLGSNDPWGEVAANTDKQESLVCNTYSDLL